MVIMGYETTMLSSILYTVHYDLVFASRITLGRNSTVLEQTGILVFSFLPSFRLLRIVLRGLSNNPAPFGIFFLSSQHAA